MQKKKKKVKKHNANKSKKEYNISNICFDSQNENTQIKQNLTHFLLCTIMHKPKLVKIQTTIAP